MVVGAEKCERKIKHLKVFVLLRCTDYLHILFENKNFLYMDKIKTECKISKSQKEKLG